MYSSSAFQAGSIGSKINVAKTVVSHVGPKQISAGCAYSGAPLLGECPAPAQQI